MAEPHDLTALEQAAAVMRGELSSRELVAHHLARVNALGDTVGAFVTVTGEAALAAADAADAVPAGERGPLHGVPTAIKDLTLTAGIRTTFRLRRVRRLRPAGRRRRGPLHAGSRPGQPRQDHHLGAGLLALLRGRGRTAGQ